MPDFDQRVARLRRLCRKNDCDAILVTNFTNVTYLTGFTGDDSYLLLTALEKILVTDGRYSEQLKQECPGLDLIVRSPGTPIVEAAAKLISKAKPPKLGVEANSVTISAFEALKSKTHAVEYVPTQGLVEQLRLIKDREEIAEIREAIRLAQRAMQVIVAALRADQTEKEIAHQLEHQIRAFGGDSCSFPPIVACGARAALPHANPGDYRLGDSDLVLVDWGAKGRLYVSDLTRVFVTGKISPKLVRVYDVVLKAQRAAIDAVKPGVAFCDVDSAARSVITSAGYGKFFRHGLGHGIGLEIHEEPRLGPGQDGTLRAGMVVTVEPGIYLPGWGGVRIEDDVLVTRNGREVLSSVSKELAQCAMA